MSVFAAQQPSMFAPPSYSRSPRNSTPTKTENTLPTYKSSPSSISIPSISKLSFSFEPVKRIFSGFSNTSAQTVELPPSHFSQPSTANSSETELSTVATRTTHSSSGASEVEDIETVEPVGVPPPTYSPIKVPSPSARQPTSPQPPAYEVQEPTSNLERTATRRPQTVAGRPPITSPYSDYDSGYYGSYLGETWARSHAAGAGGRRDGEPVDGEKEESGCWCSNWWVMNGSPTMPWVAYYVF